MLTDFDFFETIEGIKDFALAEFTLAFLFLILSQTEWVSSAAILAGSTFIGLPIYFKVIVNLIQNKKGVIQKFKSRHGLVALFLIPFMIYLIFSWPFTLFNFHFLLFDFLLGFLIVFLTFRYFLTIYKTLDLKEKSYRLQFSVLVFGTLGASLTTIILTKKLIIPLLGVVL